MLERVVGVVRVVGVDGFFEGVGEYWVEELEMLERVGRFEGLGMADKAVGSLRRIGE